MDYNNENYDVTAAGSQPSNGLVNRTESGQTDATQGVIRQETGGDRGYYQNQIEEMDRRASRSNSGYGRMDSRRASRASRSGSAAQLSTSYHRARTASGLAHGLIESVTLKLAADSKETQLPAAVKKKALIACLLALTIGNMMIENMASFMPPFIDTHVWVSSDQYKLTSFDVSLILSIFSVAQVIFAPFNSIIKNKLGAKNAVLVGFSLLTIATFGLGAIANFTDPHIFKYFAVGLRFIQGQGDIMLQITCYTLITQMYVEDIMNMIRYIEICVGLGLGLGPFLGSLVYSTLDYQGTIYLFGFLNLFGVILAFILIPNELNRGDDESKIEEEDEILDEDDEDDLMESIMNSKRTISWGRVLCNRHASFALLVCFFGTWAIIDYTGFIATELVKVYGIPDDTIGYLFAAQCSLYLVMCLIYPYTFEHMSRKLQFVIALFGMGCCHLLMGPSQMLNLPNELWIVILGMVCIGIFQVFIFVPIIPEMIERLQVGLQVHEQDEDMYGKLNDKVNDSYGFVYALTQFIAPLASSQIYESVGMREKFDITSIMFFSFALILIVFNCGFRFQSENTQFYEEFAKYQTQELDEDDDEDENEESGKAQSNDDLKSGVGKINPSTIGSDMTGMTDGQSDRLLQN